MRRGGVRGCGTGAATWLNGYDEWGIPNPATPGPLNTGRFQYTGQIYLTDLGNFAEINKVYAGFFSKPFPARACYEVRALPKGAKVEIEAVIAL